MHNIDYDDFDSREDKRKQRRLKKKKSIKEFNKKKRRGRDESIHFKVKKQRKRYNR